mgnify:CR=1 FL=1
MIKSFCLFFILLSTSFSLTAKGVYQTSEQFIAETLGSSDVEVNTLWLSADDKAVIQDILSHKYARLRIRYWQYQQHVFPSW